MIKIRPANDRGHANHGWLDSHHSFSFASYYDPRHMGFRRLRVINEDRVQPGMGFGTHGHRDMEIISYVIKGALEHKDSMNNSSIIKPGEVQRMSAGSGVTHSEYNQSQTDGVHFLQIWIEPAEMGIQPGYEQKDFSQSFGDQLTLTASPNGADGSVKIHQDVNLYVGKPSAGAEIDYPINSGRHAWVQVVKGELDINGHHISSGDGADISEESALRIAAKSDSEFLLFDLT